MIFSNWYTDTVRIERVEDTVVNGITRHIRKTVDSIPCRVYSTAIKGMGMNNTASRIMKDDKLSCSSDSDIQSGDILYVTRGGNIGKKNPETRYIAGSIQQYYDPVGLNATQLEHMEVGLLDENINHGNG